MSTLLSYRLLVTWQARRMRMFLPLGIVVQALFALGIVAGYPLLFPTIDRTTVLYLATGAPVIALITMGLVAVPQLVAAAKTEGTLAYMRSLPIPRVVYLLADMTVWLAVVLPGVVFAVIIASIRFGLDLEISPLVVPAVVLVALTATSIGYALASLLPPMVANMASQVLVIFILMFSPLNFPADRLPLSSGPPGRGCSGGLASTRPRRRRSTAPRKTANAMTQPVEERRRPGAAGRRSCPGSSSASRHGQSRQHR
jgi:ABC-2 type transport system permease protein